MKMILVKIGGDSQKLFPAIAIGVIPESGMVALSRPVPDENGDLTDVVPRERCLQFNAELLDMVNTLAERAAMASISIEQLMQVHAEPAEFEDNAENKINTH